MRELISNAERWSEGNRHDRLSQLGLSVWVTPEAVSFAREALSYGERFIVEVNVTATDGRVQHDSDLR